MQRIILVYGAIAGTIEMVLLVTVMLFGVHGGTLGMVLGYLSMLIALSLVFAGVKKYRDEHLGGVIGLGRAFLVGLGIAGIAALFYVLGWEIYMWATDYTFAQRYVEVAMNAQREKGASPAELAALHKQLQDFVDLYANPLVRMAMTLSEIAPVALIVPLLSALLLSRPSFMPPRK